MENYLEDLLREITPTQDFMEYFKEVIIEKWEKEHSEFDQARKLGEKRL